MLVEFGAPRPRPPSRHAWILPLVLLVLATGGGSAWRIGHHPARGPAPRPSIVSGSAEPVLEFAAPGAAMSTAPGLDAGDLTLAAQAALPDPVGAAVPPDTFQAASEFWQETSTSQGQYRLDVACAGQGRVRLTVSQLAGPNRGQVYVREPVVCAPFPRALQFRFSVRGGTFGLVVQPSPGTAAIVALRQEPSVS